MNISPDSIRTSASNKFGTVTDRIIGKCRSILRNGGHRKLIPQAVRWQENNSDLTPPDGSEEFRTFHLFPQLPVEVRLEIWRIASPPRHVGIRRRPPEALLVKRRLPFVKKPLPLPECCPHRNFPLADLSIPTNYPRTLWVNQESRNETLRHSSFISLTSESDVKHSTKGRTPILLDARRDSLFLFMVWGDCRCPGDDFMSYLDVRLHGGLRYIETLEYRNVSFTHFARHGPWDFDTYFAKIEENIIKLKGLKNIVFTNMEGAVFDAVEVGVTCHLLMSWFGKRKSIFGGQAPRLSFRDWTLELPVVT